MFLEEEQDMKNHLKRLDLDTN